jgi:hypothetical protein
LEKSQEYSSDKYLVFQIRLQIIADAAIGSFPFHGRDYWDSLDTPLIGMVVKSLEADLKRFQESLEPKLVQSSKFLLFGSQYQMLTQ